MQFVNEGSEIKMFTDGTGNANASLPELKTKWLLFFFKTFV